MYSKHEAAKLKTEFWTTLGQYMKPIPSAWKEKVNWLNYKTGVKDVYFRMHADTKSASIQIELTHKDEVIRHLVFEQFEMMRRMLEAETGEAWQWQREQADENGMAVSIIGKSMHGCNVMKREDWSALIAFFKPSMLALDQFWANAKDGIEMIM